MKKTIFLLVCLAALPQSGFAAIEFGAIRWQRSVSEKTGPKIKFADARELRLARDGKTFGKIRIVVPVRNTGARPLEGNIFRCAFSMRLAKEGDASKQGVWGVPFIIEERRVAKIKPFVESEIAVSHIDLQVYLKRIRESGFWPDALKVSIMIEPKAGDETLSGIAESVINVVPE